MTETTTKAVTVENLGTFKAQMETVIDTKVADAGVSIEYATEQDILDLFNTDSTGTDDTGTDDSGTEA